MSRTSELIERAIAIRPNAYAPYSGYEVGCALLSSGGQIFGGVNFENLSYGGTICAERNAIGAMISAGETEVIELAVATKDHGTPCGLCLQVLSEFGSPKMKIHCTNPDGQSQTYTLKELLPFAFKSSNVAKSNS